MPRRSSYAIGVALNTMGFALLAYALWSVLQKQGGVSSLALLGMVLVVAGTSVMRRRK